MEEIWRNISGVNLFCFVQPQNFPDVQEIRSFAGVKLLYFSQETMKKFDIYKFKKINPPEVTWNDFLRIFV